MNKNIGDAFLCVWKLNVRDSSHRQISIFSLAGPGHKHKLSRAKTFLGAHQSGAADAFSAGGSDNNDADNDDAESPQRKPSGYVHHLSNSHEVVDHALQAFLRIRKALLRDASVQRGRRGEADARGARMQQPDRGRGWKRRRRGLIA